MELISVKKSIFFDEIERFNQLPISYNRNIDIFLEKQGFKMLFFYLKKNGEFEGFLPIAKKNNFFFSIPYFSYGLYLINPPNTQIIHGLKTLFKKQFRNYYIRVFSYDSSFSDNYKTSVYLKLQNNIDNQLSFFKSKLRSQIKKSIKNKLKIISGSNELVDSFYLIYSKHMHSLGSPSYSKSFFHDFMSSYQNDAVIFLVEYNKQYIACSLCLINKKNIEVILASSIREYNYLSSNMFLYWEMIKYSISKDIDFFSFGRCNFNSTQLKFKKQWSKTQTNILKLNSNKLYNLKFLKILFSFFYKKIPFKIAIKFGSIIANRIY